MKLQTAAAIGLLLISATASADTTAVYDLAPKNAKEIARAIQAVLNAQCVSGPTDNPAVNQTMCHAELLPTGQLLVAAPAASQSQVSTVLKAIAARNASPTPRVTLQYWVIYGAPGKADADPALRPLAPVLQQLERAHGQLSFSLEDTTSITAQSGTSASAVGGSLQINQRADASGDGVDVAAQISFARRPFPAHAVTGGSVKQSLNVRVTIKRGEFVVLGERTAGEPDEHGMLFYVVHWPQGQ